MAEYIKKEQVVQYLYNQAEALDEAGGSYMAAVHARGWADAIKKWPSTSAEAAHAHWIFEESPKRVYCSNCHGGLGVNSMAPPAFRSWFLGEFQYCQKCGARMDEAINEDACC